MSSGTASINPHVLVWCMHVFVDDIFPPLDVVGRVRVDTGYACLECVSMNSEHFCFRKEKVDFLMKTCEYQLLHCLQLERVGVASMS